jgi:hypothetical protein
VKTATVNVTPGRSSRAASLNRPSEGSAPVLKKTFHVGLATGGKPQLCSGSMPDIRPSA